MEIGPELHLWVGNPSSSEQSSLERSNRHISFNGLPVAQPYAFSVEQLSGLELELESDSDTGVDSGSNWLDDTFPTVKNGQCSSLTRNQTTPEVPDDQDSPRLLIMDTDSHTVPFQSGTVDMSPVKPTEILLNAKENTLQKDGAEESLLRQLVATRDFSAFECERTEKPQDSECASTSDLPAEVASEDQGTVLTPAGAVSDGPDDRASSCALQSTAGQISPSSLHGQKAYAHCSLCNRTFRDKRSLNIHITKAHANTKVVFGNTHNTDSGGLKLRLVSLPPTKRSRRSLSVPDLQPSQKSISNETQQSSTSSSSGGCNENEVEETAAVSMGTSQRLRTSVVDRISNQRSVSAKRNSQSSHVTRRHSAAHRGESSTGSTTPMEHYGPKYNEPQVVSAPSKRSRHRSNEHVRPLMDTSLRTTDGSYKCRLCRRVFPSRFSLTGHYKSHYTASQKPYRCDECGQRYTSPSNLHYHRSRNCAVLKLRAMKDKQLTSSLSPHSIKLLESKARKAAERRAFFQETSQDEKSSVGSCMTGDRSTIPGRSGSRTNTPDQGPADAISTDPMVVASPSTGCKCGNSVSPPKLGEASGTREPPTSLCPRYHTSEWCANSAQVIKPSKCSAFEDGPKCKHPGGCQPGVAGKSSETNCDASNHDIHCSGESASCLNDASNLHVQLRNLLERACQCETTRRKILAFTTYALISALSPPKGVGEQCTSEHSNNSDDKNSCDTNVPLLQATGLLSSLTDNNRAKRDMVSEPVWVSPNRIQVGPSDPDPTFPRLHKTVNNSSPSTSSCTTTDTASILRPSCAHCACTQNTYSGQESPIRPFCFSHSVTRSAFSAPSEQDCRPTPPRSGESHVNLNPTDCQPELVFPAVMMALNGWPNPSMEARYLMACSDCDRLFSSPTACRMHYTKAHMTGHRSK